METPADYRNLEISAYQKISELINFSGSLAAFLERLLGFLLQFTEAEGGLIILFDEDTEKLIFQFDQAHSLAIEENTIQENLRKSIRQKIEEGIAGWAMRANDCLTVSDAQQESKFKKTAFTLINFPVKNLIVIPLRFQGRSAGVVELYNKLPKAAVPNAEGFTGQDVQLLGSLSSLISTVVENACLLNESDQRLSELNGLVRATELINSALNLGGILDLLMPLGMQVVNAEASSLLLSDEESGQLYFVAASGVKKDQVRKVYLKKGEGIAGWVAEHGEAVLISDVSRDPRFTGKVDAQSGFSTKSMLAVPLKSGERLIGVMEAINKKGGGEFSSNDMRLLRSLAATGAFAIQKARLFKDLNDLFIGTIRVIADAIEAKDPYTRGHSERIRHYSLIIAKELNIYDAELSDLELAALLHDVGKIGVPEGVLRKETKLTEEDWQFIRRHPVIGADLLSSIKQLKKNVIPSIRYHQERYDGKGYPEGLAGETIPLFARIIAVADAFDAMTSQRPYRDALSDEVAVEELKKNSGIQFDPGCIEAFLQAHQKGLIIK